MFGLLGLVLVLLPAAVVHAAPLGAVPARRSEATADGPGLGGPLQLDDPDAASRILRLDDVKVVGAEQVSLRQIRGVLRREGLVAKAEIVWPSDPRVDSARDRLRATGYFRRVSLRIEPVPGTRDRVVLLVELEERPTISIRNLYLGSSAMTPFRGGLSLAERNFAGRGVQLGGALVWSTLPNLDRGRRQQSYKIFVETPPLGRAKLGMLASAYLVSASEPYRVAGRRNDPNPNHFRAYDYTRAGGLFGLTIPVVPDLLLGVDYRFEHIDSLLPEDPLYVAPDGTVEAINLAMRPDVHRLTTMHFGLHWDGRGDAVLVGKGGRFGLDIQLASPALGSQYEYMKLVAAGAYTVRLPWRHWLTPKIQGGQIAGTAPIFELFYAGDLSAWTPGREQGLRFSTRNPIDVLGTGIDERSFGTLFGRFDLEYVWPLFRRTRTRGVYAGDLFVSGGVYTLVADAKGRAAFRDAGEFVVPTGFNADLGVRLDTAFGTISVSVGNVLRRSPL